MQARTGRSPRPGATEQLKRLDGIATILAKTAARDAVAARAARRGRRASRDAARALQARDAARRPASRSSPRRSSRTAAPTADSSPRRAPGRARSRCISRQLANPFLAPDFSAAAPAQRHRGALASWELLGPLFRVFEDGAGGDAACMALPEPAALAGARRPRADAPPGAGRRRRRRAGTAPSCSPTSRASARPRRRCWPPRPPTPTRCSSSCRTSSRPTGRARRHCGRRTARRPSSTATATTVDAFADIVVVNYEVLDRHVGWLGDLGFRGMVVDEAHFIKNKTSQRSQHVLELSERHPRAHRAAAAHGADRHAAHQRHRGLPRDLAVPRLDRRQEAAGRS